MSGKGVMVTGGGIEVPENPEIVEFPKSEPFWNGNFRDTSRIEDSNSLY